MLPRAPRLVLLLAATASCDSRWTTTAGVDASLPSIDVDAPAAGALLRAGDALRIEGTVRDAEDPPATIRVSVGTAEAGDLAAAAADASGHFAATIPVAEGTSAVVVTAEDPAGNVASLVVPIDVRGPPLAQPGLEIRPAAPVTGDAIEAIVAVPPVAADGSAVTTTWSWTRDGVDAGIAEPTIEAGIVARGETWSVTAQASSADGSAAPASATVLVGDAPPSLGTVEVEPTTPVAGDALTCLHDPPADLDDDSYAIAYRWEVEGLDVGETTPVLVGAPFARGDAVRCVAVLADDATGATFEFASAPVRVGNLAPSVGAPRISPSAPTEADTIACTATEVRDADGDPVELDYAWTVGGLAVGTGPRLEPSSFAHFDEVSCSVTPSDGLGTGATATSATVVVANTPPGAATIEITAAALAGEPVTCRALALPIDLDGDVVDVAWSWTVAGVASAETSATLQSEAGDVGAEVACTATTTDGYELGDPVTAAIVLGGPTTGTVVAADAAVATIVGATAAGALGKAVDGVLDLDGDGFHELLVTAPGDGATGAAYLFSGASLTAGGTVAPAAAIASFAGTGAGESFGGARAAAGAGDMDGDGLGDLALAAVAHDGGGKDAGMAWLLYGSAGAAAWALGAAVDTVADASVAGSTGAWIGARMDAADLDGDGLDDLALAAPYSDAAGDKSGEVAVFLGGARRLGAYDVADADARVLGDEAAVELGWSLHLGGDGDEDGYADLALGVFADAPGGLVGAGSGAVVSGDALGGVDDYESIAYLLVRGDEAGAHCGYDVASAGDVDGDGIDDWVFGSHLDDGAGADAGSVALFYGRAGMNRELDLSEADARFDGTSAGERFASALQPAGDVDADGAGDFLVGAPLAGGGAGELHLFLGRSETAWSAGGATGDLRVQGSGSDRAGDEAAGGLDLDGNAYADLAIGAQGSDLGATDGGAVYVLLGP